MYVVFLHRKLMAWYEAVQKSDRHAPGQDTAQEESGEVVDKDGEAGDGGTSALVVMPDMDY